MTEEQNRLMLHAHLLVWVYGYNDFVSFRALMDKTPQRYTELVRYLDNIVFNQIATLADVTRVLTGVETTGDPSGDSPNTPQPPRDPLLRNPKECLPDEPPVRTYPPAGEPRDKDATWARLFYLDLTSIIT